MFSNIFFFFLFFRKSCLLLDEVPERPQMKIWRMRISRWVPKATNTHSEYVIFIAFPLQQWLHECASVLPYTHIASLVDISV
jgi:hypothetical protein